VAALWSSRLWVALAGLAAIAALAGLHFFVAVRFRRLVNPALALATLGVIVLTLAAVGLLSGEAAQLQAAKTGGVRFVLTPSPAPAVRYSPPPHADPVRPFPGAG